MRFALLASLFFSFCMCFSQNTYRLDTQYPVHSLNESLKVISDPNNEFSPTQILQDTLLKYLKGDELPKYLEVGTTYWGKINLITNNVLKGWTLHFEDDRIGPPAWTKSNGKVDVYGFLNGNQVFHKKAGVEYPRKERDVEANWVVNQINLEGLPPNEEIQLVIKVQGNQMGYPAYFNMSARSPKQPHYHQIFQFQNSFNIFMFGVTFIIFLYHLLQYIYLRERVFLLFSVWLLFCTLTFAMTIGLIIGSFTKLRYVAWALMANGVFYSFWFFGREFIKSKIKFPKLDKFILALAFFVLFEILLMVAYVILFKPQTYRTGVGIHYILLNVYTVGSFILSIALVLKKDLFARYFGIGSLLGSGFLILGTLWAMGFIRPSQKWFIDPFALAMFLQIIIYSFGIAYRRQKIAQNAQAERIEAERSRNELLRIKDLDQLKTRFFTNISHEFRTPLTLIQGPLKHAADKSGGENGSVRIDQKDFDLIQRSSKRLESLVDELMELSKLESGKAFLSLSNEDLVSYLKSVVYAFESMAQRSSIQYEVSIEVEERQASFDKDKLQKIIYNLLSNAFKYTPEGGNIFVKANFDNDYLTFVVSDSGKGMPKEELKHIFDRFYRVEGTEKRGSGIGLTLCRELVQLHNGTIDVESTKGLGTTFSVKIPINQELLPKSSKLLPSSGESEKIDAPTATLESSRFANSTEDQTERPLALVVEDNADLRNFIGKTIHEEYDVEFAENGEEGLEKAFNLIPDIVVTDVMMPKLSGFELCDALKSSSKTSHVPIILLTAKAGHENKMEGLELGADAYLTKPFAPDELLVRMKNLLSMRKLIWEKLRTTPGILIEDIEWTSLDNKLLKKVFSTIEENFDNESFSVEILSKAVGFSRSQLHRKLKALINKSPNQLITELRLNKAYELLKKDSRTVSEVAYSVGYSNLSYFTKSFKEKFGELPSKV